MSYIPEAIEDDIERTRERIDARLNALSDELTPTRLLDNVLGNKSGSNAETLSTIAAKAKENPVAAALVGAGLLGLFIGNRDENSSERDSSEASKRAYSVDTATRVGERMEDLQEQAGEIARSASAKTSSAMRSVSEAAHGTKTTIADRAEDLLKTVKDGAESVADSFGETVNSTSERLSDVKSSARRAAQRAPARAHSQVDAAVEWVKENPVPAGLMALAAGAAISSFFTARGSSTRLDASNELHEQARDYSGDTEAGDVGEPETLKSPSKPKLKPKTARRTKASAAPKAPSRAKKAKLSSKTTPLKNPKVRSTRTQSLVSTSDHKGSDSLIRSKAALSAGTRSGSTPGSDG